MTDLQANIRAAVKHFWRTRKRQQRAQGGKTGRRDYGARAAVTGGKQLDGFVRLITRLLVGAGLPKHTIYAKSKSVKLPGYFRATKEWDLLVVADDALLATIEFKSQVGPSFGNNFNNRTEEALGSATDFWTAYREGVFKPSPRPWLGYFMLLEDAEASQSPVKARSPHFPVLSEFAEASYARRYELFCMRLIRERLYDAACLLLSDRKGGLRGEYSEPNVELAYERLAVSLTAHVGAYVKVARKTPRTRRGKRPTA